MEETDGKKVMMTKQEAARMRRVGPGTGRVALEPVSWMTWEAVRANTQSTAELEIGAGVWAQCVNAVSLLPLPSFQDRGSRLGFLRRSGNEYGSRTET